MKGSVVNLSYSFYLAVRYYPARYCTEIQEEDVHRHGIIAVREGSASCAPHITARLVCSLRMAALAAVITTLPDREMVQHLILVFPVEISGLYCCKQDPNSLHVLVPNSDADNGRYKQPPAKSVQPSVTCQLATDCCQSSLPGCSRCSGAGMNFVELPHVSISH